MRIGISLGDITGIGPEVTLKALARETADDKTRFLIIGDLAHLDRLNRQFGLRLTLQPHTAPDTPGVVSVCNPLSDPLPEDLESGSPTAARAAVAWLRDGAERCLRGELHALVTAPVNKQSIIHSGQAFIGQTEFLSQAAGVDRTVMMLLGEDDRGRWLRVALATTHVPIKFVAGQITRSKVDLAIELAVQACHKLRLPRARVAVCGLNPHAGEGGELGDEEITTIAPAVFAAQKRGVDVMGPISADTLFHKAYAGECEVVVAMYHDQGLAPLKMVAFENGANWTLGLPFIRTSPDHGTAYDIAGRGVAEPSSMIAAIRLAKQLARDQAEQA